MIKKLFVVFSAVVCIFSFVGCTSENGDYTEHQDLEKNEISFFDDALHFDLKEV